VQRFAIGDDGFYYDGWTPDEGSGIYKLSYSDGTTKSVSGLDITGNFSTVDIKYDLSSYMWESDGLYYAKGIIHNDGTGDTYIMKKEGTETNNSATNDTVVFSVKGSRPINFSYYDGN
jgi:hypothetical protein